MSKVIHDLAKHMNVTDKQIAFLDEYERTLDIKKSAIAAGMRPDNVIASIKGDTPFSKLFKRQAEEIDKDPRFNRTGAIGMLIDLKDRASEAGKMELELKIIQEINRMISGNIAATRKQVENVHVNVKGIIDLTKPLKEPKTIDISHETLDNE